MIPNRQIDSFLFDDNTNINGDNTFTKYFIPEKEHVKREINQDHLNTNEIPFEKIERYFKKNLKLRNTLKQCYWDRQSLTSPKVFLIILRIGQQL